MSGVWLPDIEEPPWRGEGGSQEICPRCKIQFGYDDAAGGDPVRRAAIHDEWRDRHERRHDGGEKSSTR